MIKPYDALKLLKTTTKDSDNIRHPKEFIAYSQFIEEIVVEAMERIHSEYPKIKFEIDNLRSAAILHNIGHCIADNPYYHAHVGGGFLRRRGMKKIARTIETHAYASEVVIVMTYEGRTNHEHWLPYKLDQSLIDYAILHAGSPGERITPKEKFKRYKAREDSVFQGIIDMAEPRMMQELKCVNLLLGAPEES